MRSFQFQYFLGRRIRLLTLSRNGECIDVGAAFLTWKLQVAKWLRRSSFLAKSMRTKCIGGSNLRYAPPKGGSDSRGNSLKLFSERVEPYLFLNQLDVLIPYIPF